MTKSNSSSVPKDENELISTAQDATRRAAHAAKGRSRKGTGVNWKANSGRAPIVYGAGVASPAERRANASAAARTATSSTPKQTTKTASSGRSTRNTAALKPQQAKSGSTLAELADAQRQRVWLASHEELMMRAVQSGNITTLDLATREDAVWLVQNSASLSMVKVRGTEWAERATAYFLENHPGRKSATKAVQAAMFSLNKALSDLVAQEERLHFSALSVAN